MKKKHSSRNKKKKNIQKVKQIMNWLTKRINWGNTNSIHKLNLIKAELATVLYLNKHKTKKRPICIIYSCCLVVQDDVYSLW